MSHDSNEFASLDDLDQDLASAQNDTAAAVAADNAIPEQFRGKTLEQLIADNQAAQAMIAKQANEVGEVRALADQLIRKDIQAAEARKASESSSDDSVDPDTEFLLNPSKAIAAAVENHPSVKAATAKLGSLTQREAQKAVALAHPDAAEVTSSPEFQNWIKSNPVVGRMFEQAATGYDAEAGIGLLNLYKATGATASKADPSKSDLSVASTPSGNGSASSTQSTPAGKIFRREDIRKLMRDDPKRYKQLTPQIMKAYAEQRVK